MKPLTQPSVFNQICVNLCRVKVESKWKCVRIGFSRVCLQCEVFGFRFFYHFCLTWKKQNQNSSPCSSSTNPSWDSCFPSFQPLPSLSQPFPRVCKSSRRSRNASFQNPCLSEWKRRKKPPWGLFFSDQRKNILQVGRNRPCRGAWGSLCGLGLDSGEAVQEPEKFRGRLRARNLSNFLNHLNLDGKRRPLWMWNYVVDECFQRSSFRVRTRELSYWQCLKDLWFSINRKLRGRLRRVR